VPDGGDGSSGVYNKDDDNDDCALWDGNNHDFYMITPHASSGYKPPR
jgi:hypothetical protein